MNTNIDEHNVAHEKVLLKALEEGKDPHHEVAGWLYHTTEPTGEMRTVAKRMNLLFLRDSFWLETVKWPRPPAVTCWDNWKPCRDVH